MDVLVALVKIDDNFVEIASQQVFVGEELLVGHALTDFVLAGLLAPRNDRHSVVMLLAVEDKIKACLVELVHRDAVGALGEDFDLVVTSLLFSVRICPLIRANLRRGDKTEDLDAEFVILHSRVDQEKQGLSKETLVLRVLKQSVIVRVHCDG